VTRLIRLLVLGIGIWGVGLADVGLGAEAKWVFACGEGNDLWRAVAADKAECRRVESAAEAVRTAPEGSGVLVLAEEYPETTTSVPATVLEEAGRKRLRLLVEYPASLPGLEIGPPRNAGVERAVVASELFGPELPPLRILAIHGLHFVPVTAEKPHVVAARVAGFDTAVFGLPKTTFPLVFEHPRGNVLVATTCLSRFVRTRYAPQDAWRTLWQGLLKWLRPEAPVPRLAWTPVVRPSFTRDEPLPADAEKQALRRGAEWFVRSKLLVHPDRLKEIEEASRSDGLVPTPTAEAPIGDGSLGILEAPLSILRPDGSQMQGVARRGDCHGESAMALAFGGKVFGQSEWAAVACNLLQYYYFTSEARKRERGDPAHGAYGLVAWGITSPAWYTANYGDDNARLLLGTMATAALTGDDRWDEAMMMCLLANLRTTGRLGFRSDRIDLPALSRDGWQPYFQRRIVNYSPHMEAYLWACYLWAYRQTGERLFYDRAECALRMTMAQYTDGWRWMNGLAQEKARIVLPLAWLVRVSDTPEHRQWLRQAVEGLAALQEPCGAIREELGLPGKGSYPPPQSNEAYGTNEASLIQQNGNPVSDLLYTTNFAFLGLHEAAAGGDSQAAAAEKKLAEFLCRIQVRSESQPSLDGGWFRAFDFRRWEAWGSNADAGWGAWAIESGWTQGWITSVFGLRQMNTSLWDLTKEVQVARHFERLRKQMLPDEVLQSLQPAKVRHAAVGRPVQLAAPADPRYPGIGAAGLSDGWLGTTDHAGTEWLGFLGRDVEATIDLGSLVEIHKLEASFLQSLRLGIFLPSEVELAISTDGQQYEIVRKMAIEPPAQGAPIQTRRVAADALNVKARYVRIKAANFGTLPDWVIRPPTPAWLFIDEVLVNP